MYRFGSRSKKKMAGVNPDLVGLAYRALSLSPYDFGIIEGLRTLERQREYIAAGKSLTLHSRHIVGEAIDFAVWQHGAVSWEFDLYREVADAFKQAASEYGLKITWGGDWTNFLDGPHIQLEA